MATGESERTAKQASMKRPKRGVPEGLWKQCPGCQSTIYRKEAEKRLGFRLPASVRESYSIKDAIDILAKYSNQDPPILLKEFAVTEWNSLRLLPFKYENQGVCTWSVVLDGSDDPPVYVAETFH